MKEIEKGKLRVARAYNKKVKAKSFQVGELVWKTILSPGTKSNKFGKWSSSWEGPFKIVKVIFGNSYMVETMQGERLPRALNGRYLKKYLSQRVARCLKNEDSRYRVSPLALFLALYILYKSMYLYLFFSLQSSLKSRGHMLAVKIGITEG